MNLGYGFRYGSNTITKQKICFWLHTEDEIHWKAFLWYIADYCDIEDFGEDWMTLRLVSEKQREFLYTRVMDYDDELWYHNYRVDKNGELWKDHKNGVQRNLSVLQRLVN